jgi:hypothetical protein
MLRICSILFLGLLAEYPCVATVFKVFIKLGKKMLSQSSRDYMNEGNVQSLLPENNAYENTKDILAQ